MEYQVETAESVAAHQHPREYRGHTPAWYSNFSGGQCPTCQVTPVFETVTVEKPRRAGISVHGLSSGEQVNRRSR